MKGEKLPIVLTRDEALNHAASLLRDMAKGYQMAAMLTKLGTDLPAGAHDALAHLKELRDSIPEPALQHKACIAGAETIEAMLLEERIVAARVKAAAAGTPA